MGNMRISAVSEYEDFKASRLMWEDLLSRSGIDNVFLSYDWIDACIRHFYRDDNLLILNVYEGEDLTGIAPLVIRRYRYFGLPVRVACFIGTVISDRMDFILDGDRKKGIALIMDYLMAIKDKWDFIDLEEMADYTGTAGMIREWLNGNGRKIINILGPARKSFFIEFNGKKESLEKKFSREFHRKSRKAVNKWKGMDVGFRRYRDGEIDAERLFAEVVRMERESWQGNKKTGIFSKEKERDFHREIFNKFYRKRQMDVAVLNVDKRPIAYIYNYQYGGRLYNYNMAFDKKYSRISPGTMLMLWVLGDSSRKGVSEFDFIRGEDPWKQRFAEDFRLHERVRIFKPAPYSGSLYFLQSRVMPYLKSKKALHDAWMTIKEGLGWI